jgi:hypothetical protein
MNVRMVVDGILEKIKENAAKTTPANTPGKGFLGLEVSSEPVDIDPVWGTARRGALITDISPQSPRRRRG